MNPRLVTTQNRLVKEEFCPLRETWEHGGTQESADSASPAGRELNEPLGDDTIYDRACMTLIGVA